MLIWFFPSVFSKDIGCWMVQLHTFKMQKMSEQNVQQAVAKVSS